LQIQKRKILMIILGLILAVGIPLLIRLVPMEPRTRTIVLVAKRYGYSPSRIVVNRGDKIILKPTSLDVTHGFLLDGYPVEFIIKQQGINLLKYTWEDDQGKQHTDWDKVSQIEFVADKAGKFTFRCTQTCGNLHPFMTGELIVRPNTFYHLFISLSVWVTLSLLLMFSGESGSWLRGFKRINLLARFPWIKALVKLRSFQFLVLFPNLIVFYLFLLRKPEHRHHLCLDCVVVCPQGDSCAPGGEGVVHDLPSPRTRGMVEQEKTNGCQIYRKAFQGTASSIHRPAEGLAEVFE
jgi:hypothetical protein